MRPASLARLSRLARPSSTWTPIISTPRFLASFLHPCVSISRPFGRALSSSQNVPKTIAKLLAWSPDTDVPVVVNGYVQSVRSMKKVTFIHLNDGSSTTPLQAVLQPDQAIGCEH